MQIKKAFTLIEIMISVILLGILYTLAIKNFTKVSKKENLSIENILNYLSKDSLFQNGSFYIYGKNCNHCVFINKNKKYLKTLKIKNLSKNFEIYGKNGLGDFKKIVYNNLFIDKENKKVCLKLKLKNGKIYDKLLLKIYNNSFIFDPFRQTVKYFGSFKEAKKSYLLENYLPLNRDKYYEPKK